MTATCTCAHYGESMDLPIRMLVIAPDFIYLYTVAISLVRHLTSREFPAQTVQLRNQTVLTTYAVRIAS